MAGYLESGDLGIKVEMIKTEEEPLEIVCSEIHQKVEHKEWALGYGVVKNTLFPPNKSVEVKRERSGVSSDSEDYIKKTRLDLDYKADTKPVPDFVDCGSFSGKEEVVEQPDTRVKRKRADSESESDGGSLEENVQSKFVSESDSDSGGGCDACISGTKAINPRFIYTPSWGNNSECMQYNFKFKAENKILVPFPGSNNPIDWFTLLLDEDLLSCMCEQTNEVGAIATRFPWNCPTQSDWKPVDVPELKLFIGMVLHMGTVKCTRLQDYWSTDPIFDMKYVRDKMGWHRFMSILKHISFFKGTPIKQSKKLICHFNRKMAKVYYPDRDLMVEEGVTLWEGQEYFSNEGVKSRYRVTSVCETAGPVVKMAYSLVKKGDERNATRYQTVIVTQLMDDKHAGHALVVSNDCLGFAMAKELLNTKTYCTGLMNPDRSDIPSDLKQTKLKKGQTAERYADGVMIGKWQKSRRDVLYYVSTEFKNTMAVATSRPGKSREMPLPVWKLKFSENMHVTEVTRPLRDFYPIFSTNCLVWYRKIFVYLLQVMMLNAHKLSNLANLTGGDREPWEFHRFRIQVIRALMETRDPKEIKIYRSQMVFCSQQGKEGQDLKHALAEIPARTSDGKRTARRRCKMCSLNDKFSQTTYMCMQCPGKPALCALDCFDKWPHTQ